MFFIREKFFDALKVNTKSLEVAKTRLNKTDLHPQIIS